MSGRPQPDASRQEQAQQYARTLRWLFFLSLAWGFLLFLGLWWSGFSLWLRETLTFPRPLATLLYFLAITAIYGLVEIPLSFYSGFVLPHRYGLSSQSFGSWLKDLAKIGLLSLALGLGALLVLYWLLEHLPDWWWLVAAVLALGLSALLTVLAPLLILPLFFRQEPLQDSALGQRLQELAQRARVKVLGVFTINLSTKSHTANAALIGLGHTRRVILADTLLEKYAPEEIEVVLAHELGHHRQSDMARFLFFQALLALGGLMVAHLALRAAVASGGFSSLADLAAFPVLALTVMVFSLLLQPLTKAYHRRQEAKADAYALEMTDNPEAFMALMTRLADQNLSEAKPSPWVEAFFYDHPSYGKRVARALQYQASRGKD